MLVLKIAAGVVLGFVVLVVGCVVLVAVAVNNADLDSGTSTQIQPLLTGNAADVTVHIDAPGRFSGSIGAGSTQRSVSGTGRSTFILQGENSSGIFVAVIQNQEATGLLTVALSPCPDGRTHQETTSAAYGVVTVTC